MQNTYHVTYTLSSIIDGREFSTTVVILAWTRREAREQVLASRDFRFGTGRITNIVQVN